MTQSRNLLTLLFLFFGIAGALYVHLGESPTWLESQQQYQTYLRDDGLRACRFSEAGLC